MAEGSESNRTPIWVALITVAGGLLTAIIVNADKLIPRGNTPAVATSPTAAAPPPSGSAALTPTTATGEIAGDDPGLASVPTAVPPIAPGSTAPAPDAGPIALGGEWRDDDGGRYSFEQTGSRFELTQMSINGNTQLFGRGTISGRDLSYTFEMMTEEKGNCTARLNTAANKITGNCHYPEGGWTYVIER